VKQPTPLAVIVIDADGKQITVPVRQGSWSGSPYRGAIEIDGTRHVIHLDLTRN
jgi:hypothetical protein